MDFSQYKTDRIDPHRYEVEKSNKHFEVNILLVEKVEGKESKAYQFANDIRLIDDFVAGLTPDIIRMHRESTIELGEVEKHIRPSKLLILTNGDAITYEHLIIVFHSHHAFKGTLSQVDEFNQAFQSLAEALRLREKISANKYISDQLKVKNTHKKDKTPKIDHKPESDTGILQDMLEKSTEEQEKLSQSNSNANTTRRHYELHI